MGKGWIRLGAMAGAMLLLVGTGRRYGFGSEAALQPFLRLAERLGMWAIPAYVVAHTVAVALCLPYAIFFEVSASLLFGFLPAVLSVFSAKVLGASLAFWIGRLLAIFGSSKSATEWAHSSRYFHLLARGVECNGWRFVLLAQFSPLPSYVINYGLAATEPCCGSCGLNNWLSEVQFYSYVFPVLGIVSSILISLRIKRYSSGFAEEFKQPFSEKSTDGNINTVWPSHKNIKMEEEKEK